MMNDNPVIRMMAAGLFFAGTWLPLKSQTPSNDPHWRLVFADDFNALHTDIWNVKDNWDNTGLDENGKFHLAASEVHVFRKENVWVSGGNLVLRTRRETYSCPPFWVGEYFCKRQHYTGLEYPFTAGMVELKSPYNFRYGYIEARIKVPYAYGLWPSFWTFRGDGVPTTENASEIDIFEMNGDKEPDKAGTNLHMSYCPHNAPSVPCPTDRSQNTCAGVPCFGQDINIGLYDNVWNVWGLEWTPSKITWYLNGVPVRQELNPGITAPVKFFMSMGVTQWALPFPGVPFSHEMYVDYIRFYKPYNDCNSSIDVCNYFSLNTHVPLVKRSISIGGSGCLNAVLAGKDIRFRAAEFIEIKGDFSVPLGAGFAAHVDACYE